MGRMTWVWKEGSGMTEGCAWKDGEGWRTRGRVGDRRKGLTDGKMGEMCWDEGRWRRIHRMLDGLLDGSMERWTDGWKDGCAKNDGRLDRWILGAGETSRKEMPRTPLGCGLPSSGQDWSERALSPRPPTGGHRRQDGGRKVLPGRGPAAAPGGSRGRGLDRRGPHRPRGAAHASVEDHHHPPGEAGDGAGRGGSVAGPSSDPLPLPARTPSCSPAL